jgi:hypothetical protein
MFDTHGRAAALPKIPPIEFLRVQLSPAIDGSIFVALTTTAVDEPEPECFELVEQELASGQVSTLDAALAFIREHARQSFATA